MLATRKAPITEAFVKNAQFERPSPESKINSYFIRDTKMQGFALRITENGVKTYYAEKALNGKRCLVNCGQYPGVTLSDAKENARKALAKISLGINPNIEALENSLESGKKFDQMSNTFERVFERYAVRIEPNWRQFKNNGKREGENKNPPIISSNASIKTIKDLLGVEKYLSSSPLWRTPFHLITVEIIDETFKQLKKNIQSRNENRPQRTGAATIIKVYRYCCAAYTKEHKRIDYKGRNEFSQWLDDAKPELPKKRTRELELDADSGKAWLQSIAVMRNDKKFQRRVMADYILLTLLWGTRKNEANKLEMANIFFDRKALVFRNTKNGEDHWLPFGPLVEEILKQRIADNEAWFAKKPKRRSNWMFPSIKYGKHLAEPRNAVAAANKEANTIVALHDLRRTFDDEIFSATKDSLLTKLSVNHSDGNADITASYFSVQSLLKTLRPHFEEWERRLLILAGIVEEAPEEDGLKSLMEKLKLKPDLIALLKQQLDVA